MKQAPIRQITVGLAVTLSLLIVNAVITYRNILKLIENEQQVSHSHQVLAMLKETLSTVKDAETGQRGYLLTGEQRYLEPYYSPIERVQQQITILRQLTLNNPRQQQRIQALEPTITAKLAELKETIQLRQNQGLAAALEVVKSDRGKRLMDNIRRQVAVMEAEENQLLQQRSESSQASSASTLLTFTLAITLDVVLLLLLYCLIRRHEAKRHQQAEVQHELMIELKSSEEKFRQLAENINEIVFWISSPQDEQMLYVSPAYEGIWGRSCENLYADYLEWIEAIHQQDRELVKRNFFEQALKGTYDQEYRIVRPDGAVRWIRDRGFPIENHAGEPYRLVGIAEDITERKQSELQLKQQAAELTQLNQALIQTSSQLAERNQELDRFTYTVSHDLKAPLRAISSLSEWISEDLEGQLNEENQHQMELLRSRVYRMETLINGLLAYSRIGRTQVDIENVNVGQLIAEILDSLAPPASFTVFVQPEMPTILTRRLLLSQVFSNLISNAIKHCARLDGRIEIRATQKGEYYEFSVADNGIGIAPDNHSRVFGIFQTLKERNEQESTGIGLSIVKRIIETEGGEIFLASQLGEGATFRFTWLIQPLGIDV